MLYISNFGRKVFVVINNKTKTIPRIDDGSSGAGTSAVTNPITNVVTASG